MEKKVNPKVFFNKISIISFIIISLLFLFIIPFFQNIFMIGRVFYGIPFEVSSSNPSLFPMPAPTFSILNLILDLVIYYIVSVIISLIFSKK